MMFAVASGVWVAYRQLGAWRSEAQAKRKSDVAEEVISAANEADSALRFIRSPWSSIPPSGLDGKGWQWRERLERIDQRKPDFARLRKAQVRFRAFVGDREVDEAVEKLFSIRQEVWAAVSTLVSGTETDGDKELVQFYVGLKKKVSGSYGEQDALGSQQIEALAVIERKLYPVVRFEQSNF
ncbi:hypothetical protein J4729_16850 [Leisingera sp. HS039]|nr:hypothetical protein [Leisingera sp. HS039]MBQ4826207.1 hypothetical protein [Leisingera sp. HS039]